MIKKLLISFLTANILLLSMFIRPAQAQYWYNPSFQEFYTKVYDDTTPPSEIFGERYVAAQVSWVVFGLFSLFINFLSDGNSDLVLCLINADAVGCKDGALATFDKVKVFYQAIAGLIASGTSINGTALDKDSSLISRVFSYRSFSGMGYVGERVSNIRLVSEANAQQVGFGFGALDIVQDLWRAARNASYSFFVLITIVLSFMIMFRVKLSPQTVISVQSVLPKLVLTILAVTFSYAIAGFLVDLMYVVYGLLSAIFVSAGLSNTTTGMYNLLTNGVGGFSFYASYILFFGISLFLSLFVAVSGTLTVAGAGLASPILILFVIIAVIILFITFIFISFRILWMLLRTLTHIYLLVIFGPILITLGAVMPTGGVSQWLRNLASHLAVFPTASALFYLSIVFLWNALGLAVCSMTDPNTLFPPLTNTIGEINIGFDLPGCSAGSQEGWAPPLIGMAGFGVPLTFTIVSLVLLFLIPRTSEIIQGLISGRPFAYGTAIGEAFGPALSAGNTARGLTWDSAVGREIREQSAAMGAQGVAERINREAQKRWANRPIGNATEKLYERLKKRGGM